MDLENPELEAFEPILQHLDRLVFEGGIEALQKVGALGNSQELLSVIKTDPSLNRRFLRGCHYGWNEAQGKIGKLVIQYEDEIRQLRPRLKEERRKHNETEVKRLASVISCLGSRQIVLRRLVDAILYHQIKMQNWILRRVSLEYRIRDIDPDTLARTLSIAGDLNRDERMDFHLASDLTTCVHIGDLVKVTLSSKPAGWSLIELKEGRMNLILGDLIEKAGGNLEDDHIQKIREQYGNKAVSQAKRMMRQEARHRELTHVIEKDEGIDPMYQIPIKLMPEAVTVRDYGDVLRRICAKASTTGIESAIVDKSFRLIALNRETFNLLGRPGIAHILYHLQSGETHCTLNENSADELGKMKSVFPFFDLVTMNLYAMWPPSVFLWPMPRDLVRDLLLGRVFVFGQLDYERVFELARTSGIEMRWAEDRELGFPQIAKLIPGSPNARGVSARLMGSEKLAQTLFSGFFARIFLEFMSPSQFMELVKAGFALTD